MRLIQSFCATLMLALLVTLSASADIVSYTTVDKDFVSDLTVGVSVSDIAGGVRVEATVNGGAIDQIGDLIGLFFIYNGSVPGAATITNVSSNDGTPTIGYVAGSVPSWNPNDADISFFLIGDNGIGGFDIQTIQFDVLAAGLQAANFTAAGARVTSVGSIGGKRNDSLKLISEDFPVPPPNTEVPEPSSMLLLSGGLLLAGLIRRRLVRA